MSSTNAGNSGQWEEHAEKKEHELLERWPWILPLATGIFLGAAVFEMTPEALEKAGSQAWFWLIGGLLIFFLAKDGLDYIGQHGLAWVATLGIWLHSFLEGAVTASSYGVTLVTGLLVSAGMIFHLIPEVGAVIALLTAAGVSFRQALIRNGITWAILILGFVLVFLFLPNLSETTLGIGLALGAGGFLYLAYISQQEIRWEVWRSILFIVIGAAIMALFRLF